jgi:peptidoglycan/LPS O-acetylase OafA/YrhL
MNSNNFDFLRFLFALLVVFGHSYGLSGNGESMQFISHISNKQLSLTSIGLNGFFVISGYLIFKSLLNSKTLKGYYWRRFLRLYPGLFVVLLLTILISPFLYQSEIPFFNNKEVFSYLPNNLSLFTFLILLLALCPINKICDFGKTGDLSYGIYIYSFPIQQILMYFFKFNGKQLLVSSVILSLIFGFFSWHIIEKKAMSYKRIVS